MAFLTSAIGLSNDEIDESNEDLEVKDEEVLILPDNWEEEKVDDIINLRPKREINGVKFDDVLKRELKFWSTLNMALQRQRRLLNDEN